MDLHEIARSQRVAEQLAHRRLHAEDGLVRRRAQIDHAVVQARVLSDAHVRRVLRLERRLRARGVFELEGEHRTDREMHRMDEGAISTSVCVQLSTGPSDGFATTPTMSTTLSLVRLETYLTMPLPTLTSSTKKTHCTVVVCCRRTKNALLPLPRTACTARRRHSLPDLRLVHVADVRPDGSGLRLGHDQGRVAVPVRQRVGAAPLRELARGNLGRLRRLLRLLLRGGRSLLRRLLADAAGLGGGRVAAAGGGGRLRIGGGGGGASGTGSEIFSLWWPMMRGGARSRRARANDSGEGGGARSADSGSGRLRNLRRSALYPV